MSRAGHHGDSVYKFEDNGFNSSPNDDEYKLWGGSATMDTWEGSHQAKRVFNADEYAAEIVKQVFDGAWSITCNLTQPPWWIATVFGQPGSGSLVSGSLYDYTYNLTDSNNPTSLRIYNPTDGFSNYEMLGGCVVSSITIDQSQPNSPECTITGAYAAEPTNQGSPSVTIPDFEESTFINRDATLDIDGTTVARVQGLQVTLEANVELANEVGSASAVDFIPQQFTPSIQFDHIVHTGQSNDFLDRFRNETQSDITLTFDNGQSGDSQYAVDFVVENQFPNQWNESGRNDPEAQLIEELQGMGETATAEITTTVTDDDTAGEVPGTA